MIGVANPTSSLEARWTPTRTPSPPHRTSPSTTPCGTPPTALLAASRGSTPKLTNAELVCLAVMQALLGYASEARWLRHARAHLRGLFPYLPGQAGYNKRLRAAFPLPRYFIRALASDSDLWADPVWVADSTPVEYGRSRVTVRRSALAGWAAYGYCRSHTRWFWGLRLHLVCTLSCTACRSRSRWPTPKPTSEPCWSTCWSTCWRSSRGWQQRGRGWSSWPTRATATPTPNRSWPPRGAAAAAGLQAGGATPWSGAVEAVAAADRVGQCHPQGAAGPGAPRQANHRGRHPRASACGCCSACWP